MAKKINIKEVVQTTQESLFSLENIAVEGFAFRWVNPSTRDERGWRHWRPVERNSEIGEKVLERMGIHHDRFNGLNQDTNYFYRGAGSMLAYCKASESEAHVEAMRQKAENQSREVIGKHAKLREQYVSSTPK